MVLVLGQANRREGDEGQASPDMFVFFFKTNKQIINLKKQLFIYNAKQLLTNPFIDR